MEFQTEKFQGPLGILLKLIEQEEMDITEIALAKIADEYLEYIKQAGNIGPEEMADFLVIAAKLLFIKSKALLPYLISAEEEEEISELEGQLRMYKTFVEAAAKIAVIAGEKKFLFSPIVIGRNFRRIKAVVPKFSVPKNINTILLQEKFLSLLERLQVKEEALDETRLEPKISIDERIDHIRVLLSQKLRFSFTKFLLKAKSKTEVIVSFLAVLELAKQRELVFEQEELFSEIHILFQAVEENNLNN